MSGLVGYGSSDEEDEIQPEKPTKVGDCYLTRTGKDGCLLKIARYAR